MRHTDSWELFHGRYSILKLFLDMSRPSYGLQLANKAKMVPLEVCNDEEAAELVGVLGLPLALHQKVPPPLAPFEAPFAAAVPLTLRLARG